MVNLKIALSACFFIADCCENKKNYKTSIFESMHKRALLSRREQFKIPKVFLFNYLRYINFETSVRIHIVHNVTSTIRVYATAKTGESQRIVRVKSLTSVFHIKHENNLWPAVRYHCVALVFAAVRRDPTGPVRQNVWSFDVLFFTD